MPICTIFYMFFQNLKQDKTIQKIIQLTTKDLCIYAIIKLQAYYTDLAIIY